MPELPEVETIRKELQPLVGRRFTGVKLSFEKAVRFPSPKDFHRRLVGQRITKIARRGKYLLIRLASGQTLILHLKMSGWLLLKPQNPEPLPYSQNVFQLDDGSELHFCDQRKFGVIWLVEDEMSVVGELGVEPLSADFTPALLANLLQRRVAPIKAVLCDQNVLAGVGNMYADEALFAARIHPLRRAKDLSPDEIERLYNALRQILKRAIRRQGASVATYQRPTGQRGSAQLDFRVAHRGEKPCPRCGTPIERIPIRNRGSYFCPRCQAKEVD